MSVWQRSAKAEQQDDTMTDKTLSEAEEWKEEVETKALALETKLLVATKSVKSKNDYTDQMNEETITT